MVGILRRQQLHAAAIEAHLVEMHEVRVPAGFAAHAFEREAAACDVKVRDLRHVPVAGGDLPFQLAGGQVVQVQVAPVGFLAEPQELVALRQVAPVHRPQRGRALVLGGHGLPVDVAYLASGGVGHPQQRGLVAAVGADKGQGLAVSGPLHILPAVIADQIVGARGAVLVRRHLQADGLRRGAREVDHHALDHGDVLVAHERILPLLDLRRTHVGRNQGHGAGLALVLLEGGDLLPVRRPHQDRAVVVHPAGVVGGVAVIRLGVEGQRGFLAAGQVAQPQVAIADEGFAAAVRRCRPRLGSAFRLHDRLAAAAVAVVGAAPHIDAQAIAIALEVAQRQAVRLGRLGLRVGLVDGRRQGLLVDGRNGLASRRVKAQPGGLAGLGPGIDQAAVVEPGRAARGSVHQRRGAVGQHRGGPSVVGRGDLSCLRRAGGRGRHQQCSLHPSLRIDPLHPALALVRPFGAERRC